MAYPSPKDGQVGVITNPHIVKEQGYIIGMINDGGELLTDVTTGEIIQRNGSVETVVSVLMQKDAKIEKLKIQMQLMKSLLTDLTGNRILVVTEEQAKLLRLPDTVTTSIH